MGTIRWDLSFSVGVRSLDEQHRQIIDTINLLITDPEPHVRSETVSETLTRLTRYSREHFSTEEELLAYHGYPRLPEQQEAHVVFRKRLARFCLDTTFHRQTVPDELLAYVKMWWVNHILKEDLQYRTFLEERGVM